MSFREMTWACALRSSVFIESGRCQKPGTSRNTRSSGSRTRASRVGTAGEVWSFANDSRILPSNMKSWMPLVVAVFGIGFAASNGHAKETIMVPMRDGVKLATDIHKPEDARPRPVILGRTPYNKNGLDGIGAEAVKRGYVLV